MTKKYTLEVLAEDEPLLDQPDDATFTLASRTSGNDVQLSVFETLDEGLADKWTRILDENDRAYYIRLLDGDAVISERRSARSPGW